MRVTALVLALGMVMGLSAPAMAQPVPTPGPSLAPSPAPTPAPTPEPMPSPSPEDSRPGEGLLRSAFLSALEAFWEGLRVRLAESVAERVRVAMAMAAQLLFTPELSGEPRLRQLAGVFWVLANGVLMVLVAVGLALRPSGTVLSRELLVRVPGAALAVNVVPLVAGAAIEGSNSLVRALLASEPDFLAAGAERALLSAGASVGLWWALWAMAMVLMALGILRIALLVLLLVCAPLVQVSWVLPATEGAARAWWRLLVATLSVPVAQALVIAAGSWVWGSGGIATGGMTGTIVDLLVLGVLVVFLVAVPWLGFRVALAPVLSGMGRLVRASRRSVRLAGVGA